MSRFGGVGVITHMILAGTKIQAEIEAGNIVVDPFDPKHMNSTSLDLTLGTGVAVYEDWTYLGEVNGWSGGSPYDGSSLQGMNMKVLDVREKQRIQKFEIDPELGWVIRPGVAYLMHTAERVTTDVYNPVLDGKSSVGRLFVSVHQTAGYGDPGFDGQYTLEVTSLFPVRVFPGMRICQMRFHVIDGDPVNYRELGHYVGDKAKGAVPSEIRSTGFNGK